MYINIKPRRLELRHHDGVSSTLCSFVAKLATTSFLSLFQIVGCEETIDDRNVLRSIEMCDAISDTLTDVIEMRCLTTNHTAENDDSIKTIVLTHLLSTVDKLEAARHMLDMDVLR